MRCFVKKISLAAITNYSGNLNCGHYTRLVKDGETWWHCNDKAVVPVNMDDISKYIYIYGIHFELRFFDFIYNIYISYIHYIVFICRGFD